MEFDHFYCDEVEGAGTTIALRDEELRPDCMVLLVFDSYFSVLRSSDHFFPANWSIAARVG